MGVVYEAEQDAPQRRVALKIVRPDALSPEARRRFLHEAEFVGRLQHAGIAQVYEAGEAPFDGEIVPFFAMELVDGEPPNRYADRRGLDAAQRLALVVDLCRAIEHAHQKGVIHRDLKPANILVDAAGRARILDFGLARIQDADGTQRSIATTSGAIVGTLGYMSPEQAQGERDAVDTRSDVYALGVIAYELLAHRRPLEFFGCGLEDALRSLREVDPLLLGEIDRSLRGDVEAIVAKALEKQKERRYQSAAAFAEDVERHLRHEPVEARAPSASYRISAFVRRNRVLVLACGAVVGALVAGLALATTGLVRAVRAGKETGKARAEETIQRRRAEDRRAEAEAVAEFQRRMVSAASPHELGRDARVIDVLHGASFELASGLPRSPLVRASLLASLGETYLRLGAIVEAEAHLQEALDGFAGFGDERLQDVHRLHTLVGEVRREQGRLVEAEQLFRVAEAGLLRLCGPDDDDALVAAVELGAVLRARGRIEEAERVFARCAPRFRALYGPDDERTLALQDAHGSLLYQMGRLGDAEATFRDVLARQRRVLDAHHPNLLVTRNNLAAVLLWTGRAEEAATMSAELLDAQLRVLGPDHAHTLTAKGVLALALQRAGRADESLALQRELVADRRRVQGERHHQTLGAMASLGTFLSDRNVDLGEAEDLVWEAWEGLSTTLGPAHATTLNALGNLAAILVKRGRVDAALMVSESAHALALGATGLPSWLAPVLQLRLGSALTAQSRHAEAECEIVASHAALSEALGPADERTKGALRHLARLYRNCGRAQDARRVELELERAGKPGTAPVN